MMGPDTPPANYETFRRVFCVNNECNGFLICSENILYTGYWYPA